jgi:hypothetical protein
MACFELLSQHLPEETTKPRKTSLRIAASLQSKLEPVTSRIPLLYGLYNPCSL